MRDGESLRIYCWTQILVGLASGKKREKVKYPDRIPVSGKTPETQEKPEKWSILKSFSNILKNNKYYFKIFGEIDFQKLNSIFKIKILEFTMDGVYTG